MLPRAPPARRRSRKGRARRFPATPRAPPPSWSRTTPLLPAPGPPRRSRGRPSPAPSARRKREDRATRRRRYAGLEPGHLLAHPADRLLHPGDDLRAAVGHAEPPGELEHAPLDLRDRPRVERDDLGVDRAQPIHLVARDGADGAEILGEHKVGLERPDQLLIERVKRAPVSNSLTDGAVDREARQLARVDPGAGEDRQATHLGRPIALRRAPNQRARKTEGAHHLGRARQERADTHPERPYPGPN